MAGVYIWDERIGDVLSTAPNSALAIAVFDPANAGSNNGKKVTLLTSTSAFETAALANYNPHTGKRKS